MDLDTHSVCLFEIWLAITGGRPEPRARRGSREPVPKLAPPKLWRRHEPAGSTATDWTVVTDWDCRDQTRCPCRRPWLLAAPRTAIARLTTRQTKPSIVPSRPAAAMQSQLELLLPTR